MLDREEELVAGYPEMGYVGLVTVSALTLEENMRTRLHVAGCEEKAGKWSCSPLMAKRYFFLRSFDGRFAGSNTSAAGLVLIVRLRTPCWSAWLRSPKKSGGNFATRGWRRSPLCVRGFW